MAQISVTSAYMWSCVVMVVFFLIAALVANMIPYKSDNPGVTKRRIWFWILCVATGVVSYVINSVIASGITVPSAKSDFVMHAGIAAVVALVAYIVLGFILSKVFANSKIGTWF